MPSSKSALKPKPSQLTQLEFEAIGTNWLIELFGGAVFTSQLQKAITELIEVYDKNYSRFRGDSLVTKMSQKAGTYELPKDAKPLLDYYQKLYLLSKGKVTPLIGQTLADAGYDASYSFSSKHELTQPPSWEKVMVYNFPKLHIKKPVLLDFGAAGKGYLVDLLAQLLNGQGISQFLIDAGGDMLAHNAEPLKIGLEDPNNPEQAIGVVKLQGRALCGSAGNRRQWGSYNHIIDPVTLNSPNNYLAVWVVAETTMLADGLTTALLFVPPEKLRSVYQFEYAILNADRTMEYSTAFPANFF